MLKKKKKSPVYEVSGKGEFLVPSLDKSRPRENILLAVFSSIIKIK